MLVKMEWLQSILVKAFPFDLAKDSIEKAADMREVVVPLVSDPALVSR